MPLKHCQCQLEMMSENKHVSRRTALRAVGVASAALLAGCSSDSGNGDGDGNATTTDDAGATTVTVGPDNRFVFEPEEVTVSTGDTVVWEFDSPSHNVAAWPDMHETISIPDGAEGFGTMEQGGNAYETVEAGETFDHTFETPGEYVYVCMPHVAQNMVGTVVVEA